MSDYPFLKKRRLARWAFLEDEEEHEDILEELTREKSLYRKRWDSEYMIQLAIDESSFVAEYRMQPIAFGCLCEMLEDSLAKNPARQLASLSNSGSAPVSTMSRIGAALIMLAGGRYIESMRTHGLAKSVVYENLYEVCDAINNHPALDLPRTNELTALQKHADEFKDRSSHGIMEYCVGAIDGLALQIKMPTLRDASRPSEFFSGSKKMHCLNMQGVCDAKCRFVGVSCCTMGSTNDHTAFNVGCLKELCASLPFPYHWVGDAAYVCTETLMTPFGGINLHVLAPSKEAANYFISQVRVTIERCFGIFVHIRFATTDYFPAWR